MTSATAAKTKTIFEGVCKEIVEVLRLVEPISIEATSTFVVDFGADSLDVLEMAMAVEDHFDIEVPDEAWDGVTMVGHAVAVVDKYLREKGAPMPLGVDLSMVDGIVEGRVTDWQVSHEEDGGKVVVICDMALGADEAGCIVSVKGQGAQGVAARVAAFLQMERL
jgi:acyl carrier protein